MNFCTCMSPEGLRYGDYQADWVGIDHTNSRFGEVEIRQCQNCQRLWLYYFIEYEHLRESSRWYRGLIDEDIAEIVTPENAVEILNNVKWCFYGGSYFFGKYGRTHGWINVD